MAEHYVGNQLPCFRSSHPSPRGGKQIHTRQKPDSAAELEKLVLEGKAGGGGLSRPQGRCLGAVLTSQVALGLPGRRHLEVLSLGDGLWPRPPEQRPLQGLWRSREPPGRAVRADGGEGERAKGLKR